MTRIDHSSHDHPATTVARQACRKLMIEKGLLDNPNVYIQGQMYIGREVHLPMCRTCGPLGSQMDLCSADVVAHSHTCP